MNLHHFFALLLLLVSTVSFGQKRKGRPVSYKTISDTHFSVGDRIDLGTVEVIVFSLEKDSVAIPDSLALYRRFIQHNPHVTMKLHMLWKSQGVKYPGRTDRTRDALLTYFNDDGSYPDSVCDINYFKHTFVKQEPLLRLELEVIAVKAPNLDGSSIRGTIGLPEMNVLYRGYNNIVEFAVTGIHDQCWLDAKDVVLRATEKQGQFVARVSGTGRTATIALMVLNGADTSVLETYTYRISNLPRPEIYLGSLRLSDIATCDENTFLTMQRVFARYPPDIPLKASYDVGTYRIAVGDIVICGNGAMLPEEYKVAYENAAKGTVITFDSFLFRGPNSGFIEGPFTRIKQSEKGTKYPAPAAIDRCNG